MYCILMFDGESWQLRSHNGMTFFYSIESARATLEELQIIWPGHSWYLFQCIDRTPEGKGYAI